MKGRVIAFDGSEGDGISAALMVDGRLEDLLISQPKGASLPNVGDVCVVRVERTLPNGRGAFCAMADGNEGFLRDTPGVRAGAWILAQVASLPEPRKAVTLSTRVLIKGPYLILTPGAPGVNVSRRIGNAAERARLSETVTHALAEQPRAATDPSDADQGMGVIVRNAARQKPPETLDRELDWLLERLRMATSHLREGSGSLVVGDEGSPLAVALREWVDPPPDEIACPPTLAEALSKGGGMGGQSLASGGIEDVAPLHAVADPFVALGVHDAIRTLEAAETVLEHGATMVLEPTRALVAIDVNTGSDFSPAAGLKANLAVARELPRQLRLRGLGGQVAIDFAPMPKKHRRALEDALRKSFRADPVETNLVGWTTMGLYELQRKRERRPLHEVL